MKHVYSQSLAGDGSPGSAAGTGTSTSTIDTSALATATDTATSTVKTDLAGTETPAKTDLVGKTEAASVINPANLPSDVLNALRGAPDSAEGTPPSAHAPILYVNPMTSAVVHEKDYLLGVGKGLMNLCIVGVDGAMYYRKSFSHGRHITAKLGQPFAKPTGVVSKIVEGVQFLPHGIPVPTELLHQIIAFFRKVMKDKIKNATGTGVGSHGSYEAMAHILWNDAEKSYRIAIPKQSVSQAAVSYTFDHILPGEEIIVDIHSHNNMGAFFSGTDNNDDKNMVSISGVAGKLGSANHELKWRFNHGAGKSIEIASYESIFSETPTEIEVPEEWMNNVTTTAYGSVYTYGQYTARPAYSRHHDLDDIDDAFATNPKGRVGGASDPARFPLARTSLPKSQRRKNSKGSVKGGVHQDPNTFLPVLLEDGTTEYVNGYGEFLNQGQVDKGASVGKPRSGVQAVNGNVLEQDAASTFEQDAYEDLVRDLMTGDTLDFQIGLGITNPEPTARTLGYNVTHLDDADADADPEDSENHELDLAFEHSEAVNVAFRDTGECSSILEHPDMCFGIEELCHVATYVRPEVLEEFFLMALQDHFIEPGSLDFLEEYSVYCIEDPAIDVPRIVEQEVHSDEVLAEVIAAVQDVTIELE